MKKYFVISDVHSFYKEMVLALKKSGYDKKNKDHVLILCGDLFDRGPDSAKIYKYIRNIPKSRRVLIRGNHEYLFKELMTKSFPQEHDFSNGTARTFCQLAGYPEDVLEHRYSYGMYWDNEHIPETSKENWKKIKLSVCKHKIKEWINSNEWVNYFELDNYIFVHSFIPLEDKTHYLPPYYLNGHEYSYKENWRNSSDLDWEDATWGCPWMLIQQGLNQTGKTIVCGHWHASDFHDKFEGIGGRFEPLDEIYYSKDIIAIDACTARSGFCNVLVIDGEKCYNQHGGLLQIYDNQYHILED